MKKSALLLLLLFVGLKNAGVAGAAPADFARERSEVEAGIRTEARASWWGFDAADATAGLQAAIDSGVKRLTLDAAGGEWLVGPIRLRSNLELIIADGVTVRALPGGFQKQHEALFTAMEVENLILRGVGTACLRMNKSDYLDASRYVWSEWRHLLSLRGCDGVTISNLTLAASGGDGIYVSTSPNRKRCRNIVVERVIATEHNRQGISVISAENLLIRDSAFLNTRGTPPAAGIDFEPNGADECLISNRVENCDFSGNASSGVILALPNLTAASEPVSVWFRNCRITDNGGGVSVTASRTTPVGGRIVFEDCRVERARKQALVTLRNLQEEGLEILFKKCLLDNRDGDDPDILLQSDVAADFNQVHFDQVTLRPGKRGVCSFAGMPGAGITGLDGELTLLTEGATTAFDFAAFRQRHPPNPALKAFRVRPLDPRRLRPISGAAEAPATGLHLRGKLSLLHDAATNSPLPLTFRIKPYGKAPLGVKVTVRDQTGTVVDTFRITKPEYRYTLQNPGKMLYTFDVDTRGHLFCAETDVSGLAFATVTPLQLMGGNQRLFFQVPADATNVQVEVFTPLKEFATVRLLNAAGVAVDQRDELEGWSRLGADRAAGAPQPEIWSLHVVRAVEDVFFRLGDPLLPVVASTPGALLVE